MPAPEPNTRAANATVVVDALTLARSGSGYESSFRQRQFSRLSGLLVSDQPPLDVQLRFGLFRGKPVVQGTVQGSVELICQRCMQPMQFAIDESFSLTIDDGEKQDAVEPDAEHEISDTEEWMADPTKLDVIELVEEQVMLALPLVPKHEDEQDCAIVQMSTSAGKKAGKLARIEREVTGTDTQRPFANLRELLNK